MAVQQPPITGDPQLDSFTKEVADTINTMQTGNVINTQSVITTDIAGGSTGPAGIDGLNRASITLFQRNGISETNGLMMPSPVSNTTVFRYNYENQTLRNDIGGGVFTGGPPWDGWYDFIPERTPALQDDFIWYQTVNIAERDNFENFFGGLFGAVRLLSKPGTGALRVLTSYEEVVEADQLTFTATINRILLGELDVSMQIPDTQVCWLLANNDGSFPIDGLTQAQFLSRIADGSRTAAEFEFYGRNFVHMEGTLITTDKIKHPNKTTIFTQAELFTSTNDAPDAGGIYAEISREIEPRILIDNVVNI